MRPSGIAGIALAVVALAGCGGSDLEAEDPEGYAACMALRKALEDDAGATQTMGGLVIAGEHSRTAKTPDIRHATKYLDHGKVGVLADVDLMTEACEAEGIDVD